MRILHVADLHRRWFEGIHARAKAFDLLVVAGDLIDAFCNVDMARQTREATDWLLSLETPTIVVSGNHDYYSKSPRVAADDHAEARWLRRLSGKGKILAVDGEVISIPATPRPVTVAAVGWNQEPRWPDETGIVVTHAPPCDCDCAVGLGGGSRDLGDTALWFHLCHRNPTLPRLILSGHIHLPYRTWARWPKDSKGPTTTILVPGCDESAHEPQRWEIDLEKGRAAYFGEDEYVIRI